MVDHEIILGYVISSNGIEVHKAKIDTLCSLISPTIMREVRSFLDHVGFKGGSQIFFQRLQ